MRAVIQRVKKTSLSVDGALISEIPFGLAVYLGIGVGDDASLCAKMAGKIARLRIFEDDAGKMNRSVSDIGGELLLVSQFTLAADTSRGNRPSFTPAAAPDEAKRLFDVFVEECGASGLKTATGEFGAHMVVNIVNDGPVTIWLSNN